MKVKEESGKAGLKLNIQNTKIMASGPITTWQIDRQKVERVADCISKNRQRLVIFILIITTGLLIGSLRSKERRDIINPAEGKITRMGKIFLKV